ncbi:hypothetical protein PMIN05_011435 [Paraphaeosphaeria minitans]
MPARNRRNHTAASCPTIVCRLSGPTRSTFTFGAEEPSHVRDSVFMFALLSSVASPQMLAM